jgi:hypothetical protein
MQHKGNKVMPCVMFTSDKKFEKQKKLKNKIFQSLDVELLPTL